MDLFVSIAFALVALLALFFGARGQWRSRQVVAQLEARYRPAARISQVMSAIVTTVVALAFTGAAVAVWHSWATALTLAASPVVLGLVLMAVAKPLVLKHPVDPNIEARAKERMRPFLPRD